MPKKGYKLNKETGKYEADEILTVTGTEDDVKEALRETCPVCGKDLTAFVASNGVRFCSDDCVAKFK